MLIILGGCVNVYTPRIPEANLCYHLSRVMVLSVLQSRKCYTAWILDFLLRKLCLTHL